MRVRRGLPVTVARRASKGRQRLLAERRVVVSTLQTSLTCCVGLSACLRTDVQEKTATVEGAIRNEEMGTFSTSFKASDKVRNASAPCFRSPRNHGRCLWLSGFVFYRVPSIFGGVKMDIYPRSCYPCLVCSGPRMRSSSARKLWGFSQHHDRRNQVCSTDDESLPSPRGRLLRRIATTRSWQNTLFDLFPQPSSTSTDWRCARALEVDEQPHGVSICGPRSHPHGDRHLPRRKNQGGFRQPCGQAQQQLRREADASFPGEPCRDVGWIPQEM